MSEATLPRRWGDYVAAFHEQRAGITERVLRRAGADRLDPYAWLARACPADATTVVDVACGSGPPADLLSGWVGLDRCDAELRLARHTDRGPVLRAAAEHLPFPDEAADVSLCSMGLQVAEALDEVLQEMARVTRPGGRVVALLPAARPMRWRDTICFLRVQLALRQRIRYPNSGALRRRALPARSARAGFRVEADEAKAFSLPLRSSSDVAELVDSLYLPGVDEARLPRARALLEERVGRGIQIPLRRVVLRPMVSNQS
jgi:SAM-dependent methyltransferase